MEGGRERIIALTIEREYGPRRMLARVGSYSAVSDGTLPNEVKLVYNAFSQLETDRQEHAGTVNDETTTPPDYTGIIFGTRHQDESFLYDATANWTGYERQAPANEGSRARLD